MKNGVSLIFSLIRQQTEMGEEVGRLEDECCTADTRRDSGRGDWTSEELR